MFPSHMEIIRELVDQFESEQSLAARKSTVDVGSETLELEGISGGSDFLLGSREGDLVAIPLLAVQEIVGGNPTDIGSVTLAGFLASRRLPVRLACRVGSEVRKCWLLNIKGAWLRVSSRSGVSWLPLQSLLYAEVGEVETTQQIAGVS